MINHFIARLSAKQLLLMCWLGLSILLTLFSSSLNANQEAVSLLPNAHWDKSKALPYQYEVSLSGFTANELNIISGIALSSIDNVYASLESEETKLLFWNTLLPVTEVTYKVSTIVPPSQFREQIQQLFDRMNVEVYLKFDPQDNTFFMSRAFTPYAIQLIALWSLFIITVYLILLFLFWTWMQYQLNLYASLNQASRWLDYVKSVRRMPFPFCTRKKWLQQMPYWEKRVNQAEIWFANAQQLLQNNEIESANVFVKKALQENASNSAAKSLENSICTELSKRQEIENGREEWKRLVSKALEFAQQDKILAALEKAYTALALCEWHAKQNRSVTDLQIDSIKMLIKRISQSKALSCEGLILQSTEQTVHINATSTLHIGRAKVLVKPQETGLSALQNRQNLHLTLPQDTLSRVGNSIAIVRQDNGFTIQDLGSTNGLWLQYKQCTQGSEYILSNMDQAHLCPPNEIGTISFQVKHLSANRSIALILCQDAILPAANLAAAKSFINPIDYLNHCWYLSQEDFYLVFSAGKFIWHSASEWQTISNKEKLNQAMEEVLKLEFKDQVYLSLSNSNYVATLEGYNIIGRVPVPPSCELCVNDTVIQIELILSDAMLKNEVLIEPLNTQPAAQNDASEEAKND